MTLYCDLYNGEIQASHDLLRDPETDKMKRSLMITKLTGAIGSLEKEAGGYSDEVQRYGFFRYGSSGLLF